MRFVWIIIWLPFFFYSCQGVKEERSVRLFHEKVKVNGEFMIGSPLEMKCLDDNLIIVDARSDAFFHWVRLPDFRYMGSFGQHGQGPGEWLKVKTLHALGNTLYSYDSYKSELFQVIPDEKLGMLSFRTSDIFQKSLTMDVFPLNANMLCAYGCFEKGMLHLIDTLGTVQHISRDFPARDEAESRLSNQIKFMAYQGCVDTDGNGHVVYLTLNSKQRYVYELKNDSLVEIASFQESFPQYTPDEGAGLSVSHKASSPLGYQDIAVGKKYFYGLYSGQNFKDVGLKAFECSVIYVYDWLGKLVMRYDLDVPVSCFCVDEKHKVFYGIANLPDPTLVKFSVVQ